MKAHLRRLSLVLVFGTALALPGWAQADPPTAEQILDRAASLMYGDKYAGLISYRAKGKFAMPAAGMSGNIEISAKAPDKAHTRVVLTGFGNIEEGCDGATAWARDPMSGLRTKEGVELVVARYGAGFYGDAEWRKRYKKVSLKGEETLDGRKLWLLTLEVEGMEPIVAGFDAETGLPAVTRMTLDIPQGKLQVESRMSDYRNVEGPAFGTLQMAFRTVQTMAGQTQEIVIVAIEPNAVVDDGAFAVPAEDATPPVGEKGAREPELELPLPPFGSAKVGDWSVCAMTLSDPATGAPAKRDLALFRIEKVDGDTVELSVSKVEATEVRQHRSDPIARSQVRTLRGFLQALLGKDHSTAVYVGQTVEDEKRPAGGKEFACKRVSTRITAGETDEAEVSAWFVAEVPIWGLLGLEVREGSSMMALELLGYGNGPATAWGSSAEDLVKTLQPPKKD